MAPPPKKSDRRRRLRAQARTGAVRRWADVDGPQAQAPEQRFLQDCALALLAGTVALHALGGLVYGQLSVFVLDGFADLRGRGAVCGAMAEGALAAAWASHLAERRARAGAASAWAQRLPVWRGCAYLLAGVLAATALVLGLVDRPRLALAFPLLRWPGLAPQSEWLLAPLPWAWHWLLPVASDRLQPWGLIGAGLAAGLGLWCTTRVVKWWRTGLACYGLALVLAGFWALGGAVYHYVAGRGLAAVQDTAMAAMQQARPGLYNADTLLWLLAAGAFTLAGVLFIAGAAYIPKAALERSRP